MIVHDNVIFSHCKISAGALCTCGEGITSYLRVTNLEGHAGFVALPSILSTSVHNIDNSG